MLLNTSFNLLAVAVDGARRDAQLFLALKRLIRSKPEQSPPSQGTSSGQWSNMV